MRNALLRAAAAALALAALSQIPAAEPAVVRSSVEAQKRLNEVLQERGLPALTESAYGGDPADYAWIGLNLGTKPASGLLEPSDLRNALSAAAAAQHPLDDASVAAARGLTLEQLRAIREQRSLSNTEILTLNTPRLRRFVQRLTQPKASPDGYFRYRNSFLVDESGTIPDGAMQRAFVQARKMPLNPKLLPAAADPQRSLAPGAEPDLIGRQSWTWRGPGNIGGRIRAMLIDPADRTKLWIGAAGGGIWKSTNAGASWAPVDDFMPNLAVCALLFDPTNSQTMYAGTGEISPNLDAIRGLGIFKSADGGSTWALLPGTSTNDFSYVGRLAASADGTTLLAATKAGVMRSTDSGATWTKTYTSSSGFGLSHVAFDPSNSSKAIASGYGGQLRYSTNGGATWLVPTGTLPSASSYSRVECAYARSNPAVVYAIAEGQSSPATRLFKSTNGGATYAEIFITGSPDIAAGQGWYDLLMWVDPQNPNRLIAGGVDLWRSTDGGVNFTNITNVYTGGNQHPDQHLFVSDPGYNGTTNKRGYLLNDGGVARTEDLTAVLSNTTGANAWTKLNNNLGITQFYGGAGDPATGMLIGGTQDNGTLRLANSAAGTGSWSFVIGADGGFTAVDQGDTRYVYGETQNLGLRRSTDGGSNFSSYTSGIGGTPDFIAPFVLDPNNGNILHYGSSGLYTAFSARSGSAFFPLKASSGSFITAIGVAPGNGNIIYLGQGGTVFKTTNALNGGTATWTQVGSGTLPSRRVTRFAIDRNDNNRVFVSFGGFLGGESFGVRAASNLWKSVDGGTTWTNSHGNLPLAPIYCVLIDPGNSNILYVGTDAGVYASQDGGATWSGTNLGPATAPVVELFVFGTNIVAVTHGRGMFLAPAFDTTPPTVVITPDATPTNASPIRFRLTFSETVTGLTEAGLSVSNGTAGPLSGSGRSYVLPVTPDGNGPVSVTLASGAVQDLNGNANAAAASATAVAYDPASPFLFASAFDSASAPTGWVANAGWSYGVSAAGTGRPTGDHTGAGGRLYATSLSGNYANGANTYLTTPVFDLPAGRAYKLRFYMWLRAESGQDGGNLEISVDGGAFTLVPGAQLSLPYNGTIAALSGSPAGWTGTGLGAWNRVRLDLSAHAGKSVQFRFHFGSGASVTEAGWFLDDFAIEQTPVLTLSPSVQAVAEGGSAQVNIDLAPKAPEAFNAAVGATGTAAAGTDYGAVGTAQSVPAGAAQKSFTVAPVADGTQAPRRQTVILTLAGGPDYTVGAANTATVVLLGDGGYDQWRQAKFTAAQLAAQPGVTGVNDTPANDGVSNLLKYALGLDPFTPSAGLVPVTEVVNIAGLNYLQIRFVRPTALANATYVGETSGDLVAWSSSPTDVETLVSSGPGPNQQTVIYRDRTPIAAPLHRFLRLRVTTP
ncbi:MAG: hypothetical protein JSR82_19285 [Verrucomicrobia bacterium]|nr:hypothetical protein [Verrucomicrobiota bacterium]